MVPELFVLSIGNPPVALSNETVASTLYEVQSFPFPDLSLPNLSDPSSGK